MIEVTDEMVTAWRDGMTAAAAEAVRKDAPLTATRDIARAGLAAVLALVERDYDVAERVQTRCGAGGPRWAHCQRGPEHPGQHAHSGPDGVVKW